MQFRSYYILPQTDTNKQTHKIYNPSFCVSGKKTHSRRLLAMLLLDRPVDGVAVSEYEVQFVVRPALVWPEHDGVGGLVVEGTEVRLCVCAFGQEFEVGSTADLTRLGRSCVVRWGWLVNGYVDKERYRNAIDNRGWIRNRSILATLAEQYA